MADKLLSLWIEAGMPSLEGIERLSDEEIMIRLKHKIPDGFVLHSTVVDAIIQLRYATIKKQRANNEEEATEAIKCSARALAHTISSNHFVEKKEK